jgi:hypothetical protein
MMMMMMRQMIEMRQMKNIREIKIEKKRVTKTRRMMFYKIASIIEMIDKISKNEIEMIV